MREARFYEAAWQIAEQRTRDAQAQVDLLQAEVCRLRGEIETIAAMYRRLLLQHRELQQKGRELAEAARQMLVEDGPTPPRGAAPIPNGRSQPTEHVSTDTDS